MSDKEEEGIYPGSESDDATFVNHINPGVDYANLEVVIKNEDADDYNVDREIKDEPMDEYLMKKENDDSLHDFNVHGLGNYEPKEEAESRVQMKEEEPEGSIDEGIDATSVRSSDHDVFVKPSNPLDPLDSGRIQTIRDCINTAITRSLYKGERREQLKEAVYAILNGQLSGYSASKTFNVPQRTLWDKVRRVRKLLPNGIFAQKKEDNSLVNFNIEDFGNYESMEKEYSRERMEEEEQSIESPEENDLLTHSTRSSVSESENHLESERIRTIREAIGFIVIRSKNTERKEQLKAALYAIYLHQMRIVDASKNFDLPNSNLKGCVRRVQQRLGSTFTREASATFYKSKKYEAVTLDGIILPNSIAHIKRLLKIGDLDYSKARPFIGTRAELKEKLISIIQVFHFQGDSGNLAECIINSNENRRWATLQALENYKINREIYGIYNRIAKIFIDFDESSFNNEVCKYEVCKSEYSPISLPRELPLNNGRMEFPLLLPIPTERMIMNDWEIKKEEMKEEPIESPF